MLPQGKAATLRELVSRGEVVSRSYCRVLKGCYLWYGWRRRQAAGQELKERRTEWEADFKRFLLKVEFPREPDL